jgi:hypothetical protein
MRVQDGVSRTHGTHGTHVVIMYVRFSREPPGDSMNVVERHGRIML